MCAGSEASPPASLSSIAGHILTLGVLSSLHLEGIGECALVKNICFHSHQGQLQWRRTYLSQARLLRPCCWRLHCRWSSTVVNILLQDLLGPHNGLCERKGPSFLSQTSASQHRHFDVAKDSDYQSHRMLLRRAVCQRLILSYTWDKPPRWC